MNGQIKVECGACMHYRASSNVIGFGTCVALPPFPVLITQNGQQGFTNVRPQVSVKEGCSLFHPRPVAANDIPSLE